MSTVVTGGTVATDGSYTVRTFTSSGTLTVSGGTLTDVQYLLIAGGSRAGVPAGTYAAGGGAGGALTGNVTIAPGSYPVIVGAVSNNSSFLNMVANGGGYGSNWGNGQPGGSGGGGGVTGTVHINFQSFVGGNGVAGQGYAGGAPAGGGYPPFGPGGGGGAGGAGSTGSVDGVGGQGGAGIASNVTGTLTYYAAGGTAIGPKGIGNNSPGYNNYGAGGGYSQVDGTRINPQPGVLILKYLSV